ncbi:hypothetical protein [Limnobacter parvus]|uniref:Carboxypeptidase regulatory-like domain-containing protein n=1 Tax=Limnobacter parvus TaxID=2939690 RepID=A0ABT1XD95_9BURK|nr:hypothetical protein [Limnobacter parvus]MCR2745250.1 hypothetical protein [Limnobacter parvus]
MKNIILKVCAAILLTGLSAACGGGSADSSKFSEKEDLEMLHGVASNGGPMADIEIVAVENGGGRSAATVTQADGSFELNVTGLDRPLYLTATNKRTADRLVLSSIAFEGQMVANINEASHAITLAMGSNPTQPRQTELHQALISALVNYLPPGQIDFIQDKNYRADFTGADSVLAQVLIEFDGLGIDLESRADRTRRGVIRAEKNPIQIINLPATAVDHTVDVVDLRNLLLNYVDALNVASTNPAKFDAVLHPKFVDPDGNSATDLARFGGVKKIEMERFEILHCYQDDNDTQQRCLIRLLLITGTTDKMDWGNPNIAQLKVTKKYDLIVERRVTEPDGGSLKLAGGQFSPYSAKPFLIQQAEDDLLFDDLIRRDSGFIPRIGLTFKLEGTLANQNVREAQLRAGRFRKTFISLIKPASTECIGVGNLVLNPLNNANCSRHKDLEEPITIDADSRDGAISLFVHPSDSATLIEFPFVRMSRAFRTSDIPNLNEASLRALYTYGRDGHTATGLDIELSPPASFNEVCISTDIEENSPKVCVRDTRKVKIPSELLPANKDSYVIYSTDQDGHLYSRRYSLQ